MTKPERDEQTEQSPESGKGSGAGLHRASRHHSEPEMDGHFSDIVGREMFACPHCGHQLSMFREARSSPGDKAAAWVASVAMMSSASNPGSARTVMPSAPSTSLVMSTSLALRLG